MNPKRVQFWVALAIAVCGLALTGLGLMGLQRTPGELPSIRAVGLRAALSGDSNVLIARTDGRSSRDSTSGNERLAPGETLFDETSIELAWPEIVGERPILHVRLDSTAASRFAIFCRSHIGRQIAFSIEGHLDGPHFVDEHAGGIVLRTPERPTRSGSTSGIFPYSPSNAVVTIDVPELNAVRLAAHFNHPIPILRHVGAVVFSLGCILLLVLLLQPADDRDPVGRGAAPSPASKPRRPLVIGIFAALIVLFVLGMIVAAVVDYCVNGNIAKTGRLVENSLGFRGMSAVVWLGIALLGWMAADLGKPWGRRIIINMLLITLSANAIILFVGTRLVGRVLVGYVVAEIVIMAVQGTLFLYLVNSQAVMEFFGVRAMATEEGEATDQSGLMGAEAREGSDILRDDSLRGFFRDFKAVFNRHFAPITVGSVFVLASLYFFLQAFVLAFGAMEEANGPVPTLPRFCYAGLLGIAAFGIGRLSFACLAGRDSWIRQILCTLLLFVAVFVSMFLLNAIWFRTAEAAMPLLQWLGFIYLGSLSVFPVGVPIMAIGYVIVMLVMTLSIRSKKARIAWPQYLARTLLLGGVLAYVPYAVCMAWAYLITRCGSFWGNDSLWAVLPISLLLYTITFSVMGAWVWFVETSACGR